MQNSAMARRIAQQQGMNLDSLILAEEILKASAQLSHKWEFECLDKDGNVKWRDSFENIVVNTGLDDVLDKYWKGSAYSALHYVGLTDGTPTVAAADTMAAMLAGPKSPPTCNHRTSGRP